MLGTPRAICFGNPMKMRRGQAVRVPKTSMTGPITRRLRVVFHRATRESVACIAARAAIFWPWTGTSSFLRYCNLQRNQTREGEGDRAARACCGGIPEPETGDLRA